VPMFLLIAIWGRARRIVCGHLSFVLLTPLAGSIFLLVAMVGLYMQAGTFSYPAMLVNMHLSPAWELGIFLALLAGFAVKIPMVPLHTWLPAAMWRPLLRVL